MSLYVRRMTEILLFYLFIAPICGVMDIFMERRFAIGVINFLKKEFVMR